MPLTAFVRRLLPDHQTVLLHPLKIRSWTVHYKAGTSRGGFLDGEGGNNRGCMTGNNRFARKVGLHQAMAATIHDRILRF
jgi:hypothetical protein